jgi:hypothetical protein
MKKIIIGLVVSILICAVCFPAIVTAIWDLEICIATPADAKGQYIEHVIIVGGIYATDQANENSRDFMDKCNAFTKKFHEEHKDDEYEIHLSIDFEKGQTIVTYKGEITDSETLETTPYEEQLVFDYIFTRKVS